MRSLGITSGLSATFQPRPDFCTMTSGTTMLASARANGRARLRLEATISACASRSRVSSAPVTAISFFRSRRASSGRWLLQTMIAIACASQRGERAQLQRQALGRGRARRRRSAPCSAGSAARSAAGRAAARPLASSSAATPASGIRPLSRQPLGDLLERVGEVAVVVERVDQHQHRGGVGRREAHARRAGRAGGPAGSCVGGVAVAVVELVDVVVGARLARRLADAVEVLALGAVLPVVALGAAELGGAVDRGGSPRRRRRRPARRRARTRARRRARRSSAARRAARTPAPRPPRPRGTGSARASARLPGAARASTAAAAGSTAAAAASAPGAARGGPEATASSAYMRKCSPR